MQDGVIGVPLPWGIQVGTKADVLVGCEDDPSSRKHTG